MKQQDKSVFDEYKNYLEEKDIDIGKNTEEKALQFESEEMVLEEFKIQIGLSQVMIQHTYHMIFIHILQNFHRSFQRKLLKC